MSDRALETRPLIEWGYAARAAPGETVSGDAHILQIKPEGALAAVVDGLGHGTEAAKAARATAAALEQGTDGSLVELVNSCHSALISTRGAVMTLASFKYSDNTVSCLGVGNVEGMLFHAEGGHVPTVRSVLSFAGVVGYHLPPLRATDFDILPGDLFVLASDGVSGGFEESVIWSDGSQQIADRILRDHYKGTDDALVLVIRYLGKNA